MTNQLTPNQALQQYFGFDHFRDGQEAAIQRTLAGKPTLLVMPTGSGKSLAYQLPALLLPGLTLVISPLIALMRDQVDGLVEQGIPATYINSTLAQPESNRRMRAVLEGHVKLLYIAPERLRSRRFTQALSRIEISLLAVDEAHCISQWGHDFRPDYLQVGPTWQAMGRPNLLATTATATPAVQQDIITLLEAKDCQAIVTGFNRPNLTFRVKNAPDARTKLQAIQALLNQVKGSAIIYTATRRASEEVADFVRNVAAIPAQAYHAGLDRQIRYKVQTDFMNDTLKVVVATNAFGMGVDKADVRAVIHYNMPSTVEAYYQEAGRAGRDGDPAECVMLFAPDDLRLQDWLINSDTPTADDLHQVYHRLSQAAEGGEVVFALAELNEITGLHPTKLRVILAELEIAGGLIHMGDQGRHSQWKVLDLPKNALWERSQAIEKRAQVRQERLAYMVDYAHLFTCRRQYLLNYFGDTSPPKSPHCCDNHSSQNIAELPKAVTPQEWFPLIVLETVRSLRDRPVGRNRLAQLLSGSQAKGMAEFGYTRHKFYGKLSGLSQRKISDLIAALLDGKYLQISGGELPVLVLSPYGTEALQARAALPIQVASLNVPDKQVERWQTKSERSDTVTQTFELFQKGLTVAEIAEQRGLVKNTIYTHFTRLIAEGKVEVQQVIPAEVEAQVVQAMSQLGRITALSPLKAILPDEISFEEIKCVLAAHQEAPSEAPPPSDNDRLLQRIVALGEVGSSDGLPELIEALDHPNGNVRRLTASALGKIQNSQAVEPLLQCLATEEKPQVRQYIIKALGRIGDQRTLAALQQIAANTEEQPYNLTAAQSAIAILTKSTSNQPITPAPPPPASSPPQSPNLPISQSPPVLILEAVAKLGGTLGRTGLAQFLSGSQAAWLETFADHSYYGALNHLSQRAIQDIIDALITDGQLVKTSGFRPKVTLPEPSLAVEPVADVQPLAAIEATIAKTPQPIEPPTSLPAEATPELPPNPAILETLRAWRTEQARIQKKPPYVIFANKVLEAIASQQPTTLAALGQISGIGPAKLEQYGATVLALLAEDASAKDASDSTPAPSPSPERQLKESVAPPFTSAENNKEPLSNPQAIILQVVTDLDGLLTVDGLSSLLTAGPGDVVSFSDHPCFGVLHQTLSPDEVKILIHTVLESGQVELGRLERLVLP